MTTDSAEGTDARRAQILQEVAAMIAEVIGEEWVREQPITAATRFSQDLEMESIELASLSEKIQARYGDTVDFPLWLSTMELDAIINLTVGGLVDHIAECQAKATAG